MSNPGFEAPLSHATEWSRPYSFLPAIESVFAPQLYSDPAPGQQAISGINSTESSNNNTNTALFLDRRNSVDDEGAVADETVEAETEDSPARQQHHHHQPPSPLGEPMLLVESCYAPSHAADLYEQTAGDSGMVLPQQPDPTIGAYENAGREGVDENGEDDEDEETAGGGDGGDGGDGGGTNSDADEEDAAMVAVPLTTSERMAQRRKMKRFRLTHQQTRFLMSEFSKQPNPDAVHRECLSRQIPGLSPRQVQVWFQNRRAKIKRLAVDDRERVIKMRAVPDDFDNIQALHSPYGAVHGLGAPPLPLASPVDYAGPSYADQQPPYLQHQQPPLPVAAPPGLGPAFALGPAFPIPPTPAPVPGNARFGRVPTVPSSTTSSSSSMSSSMSSMSSLSSSASSSGSSSGAVVVMDSDPRSRTLPFLQPLRPRMAWKSDAVFDFSALADGQPFPLQQPAQTSPMSFLPSATATVPLQFDGSTGAPSFWGLPQR